VLILFGLLGFFGYLGDLTYRLFADSLLFPFALTALGLAFIGSGLLYRRWRPRLESLLGRVLGGRLVAWLPPDREGDAVTGAGE
jgi:hypothetical protein